MPLQYYLSKQKRQNMSLLNLTIRFFHLCFINLETTLADCLHNLGAKKDSRVIQIYSPAKQNKLPHMGITSSIISLIQTGSNSTTFHIFHSVSSCLLRCINSVQFSSVTQSCLTLCNPMNRSTPGLPVHHQRLEFTQTHAHQFGDAIQPPHPLSSPSPPAPNPSKNQGLFQ